MTSLSDSKTPRALQIPVFAARIFAWRGFSPALPMRAVASLAATMTLAIGLVFGIGYAPAARAANTQPLVIMNDLGGSLEERLSVIRSLRGTGRVVEIRGECASACTLYLGLPQTCVARGAVLGFHGPQSQIYGVSLPRAKFEYWSQVMADHYPPVLRSWFLTEARKTTMGIYRISGAEAIRMGARECT